MAEHAVATMAELSDDGHVVQVGELEIALFRTDEGTVHAVHNVCPHRGGPLAEGFAEDGVVSCPWHGWEFDLATGRAAHRAEIAVACYAVRVEGEQVFVTVPDGPGT